MEEFKTQGFEDFVEQLKSYIHDNALGYKFAKKDEACTGKNAEDWVYFEDEYLQRNEYLKDKHLFVHYEILLNKKTNKISIELHFEGNDVEEENTEVAEEESVRVAQKLCGSIGELPDFLYPKEWVEWGIEGVNRIIHKDEVDFGSKDRIEKTIKALNELYEYTHPLLVKRVESLMKKEINAPLNRILFGAPGTGKTYHAKEIAVEIINRKKQKDRKKINEEYDALVDEGRIVFTTFHQSLSYEDFIEGIKPETTKEGNITYRVKDGIFKSLCQKATTENTKDYVLVIDEINRGNVSAIFGELITLLEEDKRKGNDEGIEVILPYSRAKFSVPNNVYVIGTMNTADRSVEALDTALRRRFSFVEMQADPSKLDNSEYQDVELSSLLKTINQRIEVLIDKDHQIGHSYFIGIENLEDLRLAFKDKIIPLLEEYFYGDFGKIGLVLGKSFFEVGGEKKKNTAKFPQNFEYEGDFPEDKKVYRFMPSGKWDEQTFISVYESLTDE